MKFSHVFTDRPIFATVLSILVVILGLLSYFSLPVSQYPEIAPPTIVVTAAYPGANAKTVAEVVATPLEQEINGVENMLYMQSQSTNDGSMSLTITFELGTNLEDAQVLVQNRVAIALPRLPEEVRAIGVTTNKNSPNLMMVIHLFSPDNSLDQLFISNYATLKIKDVLARIEGVGSIAVFGGADYAMRIWLDPDRIAAMNMTVRDVILALRNQNIQVASGTLNTSPTPNQHAFEVNVQTQGRLRSAEEFEDIIVKSTPQGGVVRLADVARVELEAATYATKSYLNEDPAVAFGIFQRPGSNALETAEALKSAMEEFSNSFPQGMTYDIIYNPTDYVEESIFEVYRTLLEAVLLVVFVVLLFMHSLRASIIPVVAIPVSLIGTFAVLAALGFSLNTLTLFGLVLAIGIVVDDAIVVVENVERNLSNGLPPREAVYKSMNEVGVALIAMALVLVAVFLPSAFITGISGQFYRAFAVTIAVSTVISAFVSLTLSPALCALLLRKENHEGQKTPWYRKPFDWFFGKFESMLNWVTERYANVVRRLVRLSALAVLLYIGLLGGTYYMFNQVPTGFIPAQDQGYFICALQLPPGASMARTDRVVREVQRRFSAVDGVANTVAFGGFSGATFTTASNAGAIFITLEDFEARMPLGQTVDYLQGQLNASVADIQEAFIIVIAPPPVPGVGNGGGFKMMIQDQGGIGSQALLGATWALAGAANQDPNVAAAFTTFETDTPEIYLDVDRQRVERLGVNIDDLFATLEVFMGSTYVNDFNFLGRTFRVIAQADAPYRKTPDDIMRMRVRNREGTMVPIGSVATLQDRSAPSRIPRYNLFPAAAIQGEAAPGVSMGAAMLSMEQLAANVLPQGVSFEWTELAFQQKNAGNTAALVFVLAVLFVFLLLAAQYESWTMPLAVILIVPMCLFSAIIGIMIAGQDNNILTQIGFVVLIGLASKNAILIVEFAKQKEEEGMHRFDAAVEAARLRLRPILMTSFAFILGVVPLVIASGAGAEMRQAMGVAVFAGMIGVTFFGLLLTPVFYVITRRLALAFQRKPKAESAPSQATT